MAFKITILYVANIDLQDAINWYEQQKPTLGLKFYDEFLLCLHKLSETPPHYSYAYQEFRQIPLNSFPYKIVYMIMAMKSSFMPCFISDRIQEN